MQQGGNWLQGASEGRGYVGTAIHAPVGRDQPGWGKLLGLRGAAPQEKEGGLALNQQPGPLMLRASQVTLEAICQA